MALRKLGYEIPLSFKSVCYRLAAVYVAQMQLKKNIQVSLINASTGFVGARHNAVSMHW